MIKAYEWRKIVRISEPCYLPCFVFVLFRRSDSFTLASAVYLAMVFLVCFILLWVCLIVLGPERDWTCLITPQRSVSHFLLIEGCDGTGNIRLTSSRHVGFIVILDEHWWLLSLKKRVCFLVWLCVVLVCFYDDWSKRVIDSWN